MTNLSVPVTHIDPNPDNPRRDMGDLSELEASIRAVGILQPLVVRPNGQAGTYLLVAGHRRLAAAIRADLHEVPVVVNDDISTPEAALAAALVENLQRHDIDPVDEARAYAKLKGFGWKQSDIADKVGRSASHISKRLRLVELPEGVQDTVREGDLSVEMAYEVAAAAKTHDVEADDLAGRLLSYSPEARERILNSAIEDAKWRRRLVEAAREVEANGHVQLDGVESYGRMAPAPGVRAWPVGHGYTSSLRLDFADNDAHQNEPCARFLIGVGYPDGDKAPVVNWYCVDPDRHRPDGDSDLKPDDPTTAQMREEEKRAQEAQRRKAEKKLRGAWVKDLFDTAPGQSAVDYDLVVTRAWEVLLARLEVNVAKLACQYLHLEPHRDQQGSYSWDDWRQPLATALDQDLYRTLLAITVAQGEAHVWAPNVADDSDWVVDHGDYLTELGWRPDEGLA